MNVLKIDRDRYYFIPSTLTSTISRTTKARFKAVFNDVFIQSIKAITGTDDEPTEFMLELAKECICQGTEVSDGDKLIKEVMNLASAIF